MARKTLLTLSVSVTITTISMAPTAAFAQFSPDPPPAHGGGDVARDRRDEDCR